MDILLYTCQWWPFWLNAIFRQRNRIVILFGYCWSVWINIYKEIENVLSLRYCQYNTQGHISMTQQRAIRYLVIRTTYYGCEDICVWIYSLSHSVINFVFSTFSSRNIHAKANSEIFKFAMAGLGRITQKRISLKSDILTTYNIS